MIILISIIKFLIIIVPVLLTVATLTLFERKVMAAIQIRRGPNVVGFGLLQPLADGLKLLIKELIIPLKGNKYLFLFSPVLFLALSFASWSVIPFEQHYLASPNLAILVFLAFSSLSVYGILLGGWASNSRYAFLGALRSASQMISYELVLSLLILLVCILAQSFNLIDIVLAQTNIWFFIPLLPFVLIYMIAILAETNRTPFDLPEAEAELVAGYSVEYSSGPFAFYFIAEYCNLIIWSNISVILFFGGWLSSTFTFFLPPYIIFAFKSLMILLLFCWIRAALPRYRWDQLLVLAWRAFLPLVLVGVFFVTIIFVSNLTFFQDPSSFLIFPIFVSFSNIRKNSIKIFPILILLMLWPITTVECGNFDTTQTARQRLFDLIETFSEEELNQFHAQTTYNLGERIFLAVTINLIILGIVWYGPTIYHNISNGINKLVDEDLPNIVQGIHTFFTETTREAVFRQIQNADPQRLERLANIAHNIAANRPPRFPM